MRVIRVRVLIFLIVFYLALLFLIYQYVWHSRRSDSGGLFDSPGEEDHPHLVNDVVQFNFKRRNGPPLMEVNDTFDAVIGFNMSNVGDGQANSSLAPSVENPVLDQPNLHGRNRADGGLTNSSAGTDDEREFTLQHVPGRNSQQKATIYDVSYLSPPNYCVHAFYYMWYGNPQFDGQYYHWNHRYLPHWEKKVTDQYPKGRHVPPDDIGANFYPELGCYSSKDPKVMEAHMYQLRKAGVGVVSASWYPTGQADDEGLPPDLLVPLLLDTAHKYSIKVTLHLEPYDRRTPQSVREDISYIRQKYYNHPAFYKHTVTSTDARSGEKVTRHLPLIYIYDSYKNNAKDWANLFKHNGAYTVRGTDADCVAIALLVDSNHQQFVLRGGFDGFYTYFASNRFSYGSNPSNWASLNRFAKDNGLLFIPSFGPGYDDTRVRPWNKQNTQLRRGGRYYTNMFKSAIENAESSDDEGAVKMVSLTSFNEWHEGTQIEPAVSKRIGQGGASYSYVDYGPYPSNYYLQLTRDTAASLQCNLIWSS